MKFSLCIVIVAASLRGVVSDSACILIKFLPANPVYFYIDADSACLHLEKKFDLMRSDFKECTPHKINIQILENLHKDFCNPGSDFRREFDIYKKCLLQNTRNAKNCQKTETVTAKSINGMTKKEICTRSVESTFNCLNNEIGKPCGEGGLKVYQRMSEATAPIFTGMCFESLGIEPPVTEGLSSKAPGARNAQFAGAAANSVFVWGILAGILFTIKWYG